MHIRRGIVTFATTVFFAIATEQAPAQAPDAALQSLSQDQQAWVNRSCPRSLGPSLWSMCVNREVGALKGGLPDLTNLSESQRAWVQRSCPSSLGPSLAITCLNRESNAIGAGMPPIDHLSSQDRAWVQQSCPQSLGPSLYRACVQREAGAIGRPNAPNAQAPPRATPRVRSSRRADVYLIETSHNDELFIINGEKFEAKTYCLNMEEDDEVIFLEGSPFGACASATLLNFRTREKCEVWCE